MKRIFLFFIALTLAWRLSLQAEDFIKKADIPAERSHRNWCSFNDEGYSLPISIEKTSSNNLYVTIYNNDWSVKRIFSVTGLNQQDSIVSMECDDFDGKSEFRTEMAISQYFFNDDDKYEIVIGNYINEHSYATNIRVINEDGVVLGHLPDADEKVIFYQVIGNRHYITNYNDDWYSFPGQTGAPLIKHRNDTNGDGVVNAADVTSVYNEILGL